MHHKLLNDTDCEILLDKGEVGHLCLNILFNLSIISYFT